MKKITFLLGLLVILFITPSVIGQTYVVGPEIRIEISNDGLLLFDVAGYNNNLLYYQSK